MLKQLLRLCFELVKRSRSSNGPGASVNWHRRATRRVGTRVLIAAGDLTSAARDLGQAWLLPRSPPCLPLAPNSVTSPDNQVGLSIGVSASAVVAVLAAR